NPARLPVAGADNASSVGPRQLSPVEDRFENGARFLREVVQPDFFLGPEQDPRAKALGLDEVLHEGNLVDTGRQEKLCEGREVFFAEIAAAVEVVAAGQVAGSKVALVSVDVAGEPARDRPDGAGIERLEQHCVGEKTRDAAIAVEERVDPRKAVMGGRGCD